MTIWKTLTKYQHGPCGWLAIALACIVSVCAMHASAQTQRPRSANAMSSHSSATTHNRTRSNALSRSANVRLAQAHSPAADPLPPPIRRSPPSMQRQPSGPSMIEADSHLADSPMFGSAIETSIDASEMDEAGGIDMECSGCDACGCMDGCVCDPVGYLLDWSRCDLFVGATSFATAANFLTTGQSPAGQTEGSFGFQEGFNFGSRAPGLLGGQVGAQVGLRAIQSQLEGSTAGQDARNQLFVTAGLFRRVDYGLQGGMVCDYLHDDSLFSIGLVQLRGEISFLMSPCHDAGFRFTSSLRTSESTAIINGVLAPQTIQLSSLDTYRFFYRARFGESGRGQGELHGGFSENQDGLLGITLTTPLGGSVGLAATSTYLFPHRGANPTYAHESWNLGVALVWTPCRPFGLNRDYYRPLFDVADNGSLLMQRHGF